MHVRRGGLKLPEIDQSINEYFVSRNNRWLRALLGALTHLGTGFLWVAVYTFFLIFLNDLFTPLILTLILADMVDFHKLKTVGDTAFEMLAGDEIRLEGGPVRIKIKPPEGYGDIGRLKKRLQEKGFDVEGFSKEELLFIYCYGKPRKGLAPYVKLGAYNNEIMTGLYDALIRSLAKR